MCALNRHMTGINMRRYVVFWSLAFLQCSTMPYKREFLPNPVISWGAVHVGGKERGGRPRGAILLGPTRAQNIRRVRYRGEVAAMRTAHMPCCHFPEIMSAPNAFVFLIREKSSPPYAQYRSPREKAWPVVISTKWWNYSLSSKKQENGRANPFKACVAMIPLFLLPISGWMTMNASPQGLILHPAGQRRCRWDGGSPKKIFAADQETFGCAEG